MHSQLKLWPADPDRRKESGVWQTLTPKQQTKVIKTLARLLAQAVWGEEERALLEEKKDE